MAPTLCGGAARPTRLRRDVDGRPSAVAVEVIRLCGGRGLSANPPLDQRLGTLPARFALLGPWAVCYALIQTPAALLATYRPDVGACASD